MILLFCCIVFWLIVMAILMAVFGLLENPKKSLSLKRGIIIIMIEGVIVPFGLWYMYNKYGELLTNIFILIILCFIAIYTFCLVFGKPK